MVAAGRLNLKERNFVKLEITECQVGGWYMDGWMVEVEVEEHSIPGLDLLIISYYFIKNSNI